MKKDILNRESGEGKAPKVVDEHGDPGKSGYHKMGFGGDEKENFKVQDGYKAKDESPARSEGSSIHEIAKHVVHSQFYSHDPKRHGGHEGHESAKKEMKEHE